MLGIHVSHELGTPTDIVTSITRAKNTAREYGLDTKCCQIFVLAPKTAKPILTADEKHKLLKLSADGFRIIVHSSYLSNPWYKRTGFGRHLVKTELKICDEIGAYGLIIHIGKRILDEIIEVLPELLKNSRAKLILELDSYKSDGELTYETPFKMRNLIARLVQYSNRISICIDTAHLWAAGISLASYEDAKNWILACLPYALENKIDVMFHLNDQKWDFNSGKDQHLALGEGQIWSAYKHDLAASGVNYILEFALQNDLDVILERNPSQIGADLMAIYKCGFYRAKKPLINF